MSCISSAFLIKSVADFAACRALFFAASTLFSARLSSSNKCASSPALPSSGDESSSIFWAAITMATVFRPGKSGSAERSPNIRASSFFRDTGIKTKSVSWDVFKNTSSLIPRIILGSAWIRNSSRVSDSICMTCLLSRSR